MYLDITNTSLLFIIGCCLVLYDPIDTFKNFNVTLFHSTDFPVFTSKGLLYQCFNLQAQVLEFLLFPAAS